MTKKKKISQEDIDAILAITQAFFRDLGGCFEKIGWNREEADPWLTNIEIVIGNKINYWIAKSK